MSIRSFLVYVDSDSPMHNLHPVVKLIALLLVNIVALFTYSPVILLFLLLFTAVLYPVGKVDTSRLRRFLFVVLIILQAVMLSYCLYSIIPGRYLFIVFPWGTYMTEQTLGFAFTMALRLYVMLSFSVLIFATTRDRDIILACQWLRFPFAIAFVISLSFRTMGIFFDDQVKIQDAMRIKGIAFNQGSLPRRIRSYLRLGMPLAMIALRRILELTNAAESKGLRVRGPRTSLHENQMSARNGLLLASLFVWLLFMFWVRFTTPFLNYPGWPFTEPWGIQFTAMFWQNWEFFVNQVRLAFEQFLRWLLPGI